MSTPFYDLASLVVVPSGYKASKVYAQKPLTTDGQLTFSRASTATRVNASGLIETVASNVPRLDYLGSTCPKLLLEPQRTNLYPRGSALLATGWSSNGATLTAGQTDPNGGTTALRVQFTAGTSYIFQGFAGTSSYTRTAYIKAATPQAIKLVEPYTGAFVLCNLTTSYQRFNLSGMGIGGLFGIQFDNTNDSAAKDFTISFIQIEEGSYPTSYIHTTTAAVTRLADACSKTGISSLIGQTEGTIFLDFDFINSGVQVVFTIHDNSNSKRIEIWANNNSLQGFIGGSSNISVGASNVTNGRHKVALAYKQSGDHAYYIDGVQVGTSSTSYTIAALTSLIFEYWGSGFLEQKSVRQALLFKTRLTNAQLAELTTL